MVSRAQPHKGTTMALPGLRRPQCTAAQAPRERRGPKASGPKEGGDDTPYLGGLYISAESQQGSHHGGVCIVACQVQGGRPVWFGDVHIRTSSCQCLHDVYKPLPAGEMKRCGSVTLFPPALGYGRGSQGPSQVMGDMSDMSDIVKVSLGKQLANKP